MRLNRKQRLEIYLRIMEAVLRNEKGFKDAEGKPSPITNVADEIYNHIVEELP